jgi:hypothetical protein
VAFVVRAKLGDLSEQSRGDLKLGVLDALGCGMGALEVPLMVRLRTTWVV